MATTQYWICGKCGGYILDDSYGWSWCYTCYTGHHDMEMENNNGKQEKQERANWSPSAVHGYGGKAKWKARNGPKGLDGS